MMLHRMPLWVRPISAALFAAAVLPALAFAQAPNAPAAPAAVQQQATPAPSAAPTLATPNAAAPTLSSPTAAAPTAAANPQPAATPQSAAPDGPVPSPSESDIRFKLPHDLSPWGMFLAADAVVKAVMIGLALASLLTWTIWLAKSIEMLIARRSLRAGIEALVQARGWNEAAERLSGRRDGVGALVRAARDEVLLSAGALSAVGVKERVASRLERIEAAGSRSMIRGTGVLATVGATAPFVGLFGTVWGIMNSFIGISKQHTTNLAVVAPGIAEALLATALGLVAAIPAVVMYNLFSRWNAGYRALQADASAAILRLISRDLDRGTLAQRAPAGPRAVTAAE
jgi:biopolymer transport protein ExbB